MKNRKTDYTVKNAGRDIRVEQITSADKVKILKAYQERISNK